MVKQVLTFFVKYPPSYWSIGKEKGQEQMFFFYQKKTAEEIKKLVCPEGYIFIDKCNLEELLAYAWGVDASLYEIKECGLPHD